MCGRFYTGEEDTPQEMQAILDALNRRNTPAKEGEIFPADTAAVIANTKRLTPAPFAMRWGYDTGGRRIINARSETAAQKPLFADGMEKRRCLVPAAGYFEWARRSREKTKYRIADVHTPLIFMAGIYRLTDAGAEFSILTREPDTSVSFLHDRMPVILPREYHSAWLDPRSNPQEILSFAAADLCAVPVAGQAETISFFDAFDA
ncbi:MAG: SOS response-associated peptidase [Clostridia bacterium]|nr:SOS response-associated peptidase [Clostridia bacterium]